MGSRITAMGQERIPLLALDLDPAFQDFNFSWELDPTLKRGPTNSELYRLVQKGRKGDLNALGEFADTMFWTLREAAFDAFQRAHGARAITYREWFYHKLFQFFEVLLLEIRLVGADEVLEKGAIVISSEGTVVQLDELQDSIGPEHNICRLWFELAQVVSESSSDRLAVAQGWLRLRRPERNSSKPSVWAKNQERDQIILNCLKRGMKTQLICVELDKRTIPTLPDLQAKGIHRWVDGWADPKARRAIQRLRSKLPRRQ